MSYSCRYAIHKGYGSWETNVWHYVRWYEHVSRYKNHTVEKVTPGELNKEADIHSSSCNSYFIIIYFFKEDLFTSQINQQKNCNNNNNNNNLFTIDLATYGIADKIYNIWYILWQLLNRYNNK